jgi:hypothetical protein
MRQSSDRLLELAFERLSEFCFVNLVVGAGTVHHLMKTPCLLTNPYHMHEGVLFALRENVNFTKQDYARLFEELIEIAQSSGLILCSVVIGNLASQSYGLDATLLNTASPVMRIHHLAHMENLVFQNSLPSPHLPQVMNGFMEVQSLSRTADVVAQAMKTPQRRSTGTS